MTKLSRRYKGHYSTDDGYSVDRRWDWYEVTAPGDTKPFDTATTLAAAKAVIETHRNA